MGTLLLVRHGQARPFEKVSDQLSDIGEQQARVLGRYLIEHGIRFDEVYSGTLTRQRRTAELVGEQFAEAGLPWPEHRTIPGLNEYDADGVTHKLIPAIAERDERFRQLLATFEENRQSPDRNRHFQKMFEVSTKAWLGGELDVEGVESWQSFKTRVRLALKQILDVEGSGRRVVAFTSGGVIGTSVQMVLNAPDQQALQLNWRVKNCSLTEFTFGKNRISLDMFNAIPHLTDAGLQTYR
ncbi:MAG: histidine phosphatase family protein [Acidobacteria bacterium]|nr:histidine phosphatase family protein [Acidobacteriota bacterium]